VSEGAHGPVYLAHAGPVHHVKVQNDSKSLVISGLHANTYYRLTMVAHNIMGDSPESLFLFVTANESGELNYFV
jgi:hypothetical protein